MSITLPRCEFCRWFNPDKYNCKAFPDEIPAEMLWATDDYKCSDKYNYEEKEKKGS